MATVSFPYGRQRLDVDIEPDRLNAVLRSRINGYKCELDETATVRAAMENPVCGEPLYKLAENKNNIVIIASDHTRPVPSRAIIPNMLHHIYRANPSASVTILIATGCHRATSKAELEAKFGADILSSVDIHIHDCLDNNMLVDIGALPSGGRCVVNKLASEADLLIAEGFIEPHFFAGYSGGRKSVLPGICSRETVLANHCAEFIASEYARTGVLENNPLHIDMLWAANAIGLKYIVNVVINDEKKAIYAVAGEPEAAHAAGCEFLSGLCRVKARESDIVITSNGGYPLDQNIYQSVKGMTAAEATVRDGGVIIMLAKSDDGHGGINFFKQMSSCDDIDAINRRLLRRGRNETEPDQWMTQILVRILKRARVIFVSDAPDELVAGYHMLPAHSTAQALSMAYGMVGGNATVTAIEDGVSIIVER